MSGNSDGSNFNQRITADPTGFEAGWQRAVRAATGGSAAVQSQVGRISAAVESMNGYFAAFAVAIGAGLGVKRLVDEAAGMTEAAMDMARALGITTNEASAVRAALEDVGATPEEFTTAAKGMSKQLKANEDDLKAMGLATRDAAGNLRPMNDLMIDGIAIANSYREGADRNIAAQVLFGKGVDGTSKLLLYSRQAFEEGSQAARDLGTEIGAKAVAAWQSFDAASDRATLSVRGLVNVAGQALMPVVTDIIRAFNAAMPAAVAVTKFALGSLTAAFLYVKNGVVVLWETINAMVITVAEPIRALGEAVGKALVGDFAGAAAAIKGVPSTIVAAWGTAFDRMTEMSVETRNRVAALFGPDSFAGKGGGVEGTNTARTGKPAKADKAEKPEAEKSMMAYYQAQLEQEKLVAARMDATRDYSMQQETAYWQNLLDTAELTGKDRIEIGRRVARLEVDILREAAKQGQQILLERLHAKEAAALDGVAAAQMEAQASYDLEEITLLQLLELERQHELQRADIRRSALQAQLAMVDPQRDPVTFERLSLEIEAAERAHLGRLRELRLAETAALAQPMREVAGTLEGGFAGVFARIGTQIKSLGGLMQAMGQVLLQTFVQMLAQMAAKWLVNKILMKAISKAMALGEIATESAKAGAGGVASMAAAPFPLNLSAPAFGASMSALAFGFAPLASAAQGYDIPFGVEPLTQLHQREMVLPAKYADVIRGLEEGGANGGASGAPIVLNGAPDDTVKLRDLAKLLKTMKRDFVITKGDLR